MYKIEQHGLLSLLKKIDGIQEAEATVSHRPKPL